MNNKKKYLLPTLIAVVAFMFLVLPVLTGEVEGVVMVFGFLSLIMDTGFLIATIWLIRAAVMNKKKSKKALAANTEKKDKTVNKNWAWWIILPATLSIIENFGRVYRSVVVQPDDTAAFFAGVFIFAAILAGYIPAVKCSIRNATVERWLITLFLCYGIIGIVSRAIVSMNAVAG